MKDFLGYALACAEAIVSHAAGKALRTARGMHGAAMVRCQVAARRSSRLGEREAFGFVEGERHAAQGRAPRAIRAKQGIVHDADILVQRPKRRAHANGGVN